MPKLEPTSADYQHLLDENDALRSVNVWLRNRLKSREQTIDQLNLTISHLNLRDRDREKHIGDLRDQIYQLGVANRDLKAELDREMKV
jgi:hypothetical protein